MPAANTTNQPKHNRNEKKILLIGLMSFAGFTGMAQMPALLPDYVLPAVAGGVVSQPVKAGSSTLQQIPVASLGGALQNFYAHSWSAGPAGIAWRRTDATGTLIYEGFMNLAPGTTEVDIVLFHHLDGEAYALVGYHRAGGSMDNGYYYDLYRFDAAGLAPVLLSQFLMASVSPLGINVDANSNGMGLAIAWSVPGGIYVQVAPLNAVFNPPVYLGAATANYRSPDICIGRHAAGATLEIAGRLNTENALLMLELPWRSAMGSTTAGLSTVYTYGLPIGSYVKVPRVDCPDDFSAQKWTLVFSANDLSAASPTEEVFAVVKNSMLGPVPAVVSMYTAPVSPAGTMNNPTVAYDPTTTRIQVGWIIDGPTASIPVSGIPKYVSKIVADPGSISPAAVAASYAMITNTATNNARPVLAFSGQNTMSGFDGLHTVYCEYNTYFFAQYSMVYKDKPWTSGTFRKTGLTEQAVQWSAYPNPFSSSLSLKVPAAGHYIISLAAADGRIVYRQEADYAAMQQLDIPASGFAPGMYLLTLDAPELNLYETHKMIK